MSRHRQEQFIASLEQMLAAADPPIQMGLLHVHLLKWRLQR
jgi:hypothetical protein